MRFLIFLRLLGAKMWETTKNGLLLVAALACFMACVCMVAFVLGLFTKLMAPMAVPWLPMAASLAAKPIMEVGAGAAYAIFIVCLCVGAVYMLVKSVWKLLAETWADAGYEAEQRRKLKSGIAVSAVLLAALAVWMVL